MTSGVTALATSVTTEALALVRGFDVFATENGPYGEHDFGSVTVDGTKLFWKIDYYDLSLQYLLIPQGQNLNYPYRQKCFPLRKCRPRSGRR